MKQPKFNFGQEVYFIDNRVVSNEKITGIWLENNEYIYTTDNLSTTLYKNINWIEESFIFQNKEELLKSL